MKQKSYDREQRVRKVHQELLHVVTRMREESSDVGLNEQVVNKKANCIGKAWRYD